MKENFKSLVSMIAIMIFALLLYFVLVPNYITVRESVSGNISFTSQTWPQIVSLILFVLSAYGIVKYARLIMIDRKNSSDAVKIDIKNLVRPTLAFAIVLGYALLFINFGTIISSVICVPLLLFFNGVRKPLEYVFVGAFCVAMYFVFTQVLLIPLP